MSSENMTSTQLGMAASSGIVRVLAALYGLIAYLILALQFSFYSKGGSTYQKIDGKPLAIEPAVC